MDPGSAGPDWSLFGLRSQHLKDADFGAAVETYAECITQPAIDVERPFMAYRMKAFHIVFVANRKDRGPKIRGSALATMGMTGQNDSLEITPDRLVANVGVVAEADGRSASLGSFQAWFSSVTRRPEIIQADDLEPIELERLVTQHVDPCFFSSRRHRVSQIEIAPAWTVVMISQAGQTSDRGRSQRIKDIGNLGDGGWISRVDKVARHDQEVGP